MKATEAQQKGLVMKAIHLKNEEYQKVAELGGKFGTTTFSSTVRKAIELAHNELVER